MLQSVWSDTVRMKRYKTLHGDMKTDVLIIGGGICGVLCAHFLEQEGVNYMLAEKDTIGRGITQNTTAKITSQHGLIYNRLLNSLGKERAAQYLWANQKAIAKYKELSEIIDCDYEGRISGVYSRANRKKIENEIHAVEEMGFPAEFAETLPLPIEIQGAVIFPKQAQFHPLKFLSGLAENLNIYEHTFVNKVEGHTAWTEHGKITADKMIVTTHFPFLNWHGSYFLKLYQHRSYVIALERAAKVKGMYIDEVQDGLSFRNYGDYLLLGGGGHRTGGKGGNWQELRKFASLVYPDAREKYAWATQDCMSLDGIPYIGRYSKHTPNLYVASGFNKWGMSSSMVAAMLLCDMVMERENEYAEVFSPSRSILKPQLLVNGLDAVGNLLMPKARRCTHMGCALRWNAAEHTWDCPCHGSRYEKDGKLICNPAKKDAEV